jgi:hypothetical protein
MRNDAIVEIRAKWSNKVVFKRGKSIWVVVSDVSLDALLGR